ncbi:hypothetical protein D3093_26490 (plasmid) [Azospirillum argentinense]|uniref:Uncharacterized protein n=1 Tax=Azospirillum argentinense TaxID=2970906 RepID=A0A4D8PND5_9PROT|nr:hypothetical protein D3093_26490 [Azospirillum argentinense]
MESKALKVKHAAAVKALRGCGGLRHAACRIVCAPLFLCGAPLLSRTTESSLDSGLTLFAALRKIDHTYPHDVNGHSGRGSMFFGL